MAPTTTQATGEAAGAAPQPTPPTTNEQSEVAAQQGQAIQVAAEENPQLGHAVLVTYFDGSHTLRSVVAHVLAVSLSPDENGMPSLSVAFPTLPPDARKLSGPRFQEGYERRTGVVHYKHPDAIAGKVSIVWGHAADETTFPTLIQPGGDGQNPIFERHILEEPPKPPVAQVAAVQGGKAPAGSSAPTLTSEAGAPHPVGEHPAPQAAATQEPAAEGSAAPAEEPVHAAEKSAEPSDAGDTGSATKSA